MNPLQEKIEEGMKLWTEIQNEIMSADSFGYIAAGKKKIENWLTTILEEVYKAGKEAEEANIYRFIESGIVESLEEKIKEKYLKEGEKNGLSRAVEAVKKIDLSQIALYSFPANIIPKSVVGMTENEKGLVQYQGRAENIEREIIKAIESLN